MSRAAKARIEGADARFQAVQDRFLDLGALHIMLGDLRYGAIHGQAVLPGGDDEIDLGQQAVLVHVIVMEKRATRRLADADAFEAIDARFGPAVAGLKVGIGQEAFEEFKARHDLQKTRIMEKE